MHIIYFHQHFSTPAGSTGIRSYEMAKKLIAAGHQVTLICGSYSGANTGLTMPFIKGKRQGLVDGITVIELQLTYSNADNFYKRTLTFLKFAWRSLYYALFADYNLIFTTSTPLTAALPGIAAKWLRRKPFIFEVRDLWPELPKAMGVITNRFILALMSLLEWTAYKNADALIALSPGIKEGITRLGISGEKVTIIPNGCDLPLFAPPKDPWQPPGVENHDFLAVFAGTHGIANGLQALINAAKVLKDNNFLHIKLVLIGQGKLKPQLIKQAQEYQLNNILFLDAVDKHQLARLLARADVGLQILANVSAFYDGTSPNKFFDYIAAGLPVIINYPGWLANKINEYQCGKVVEPDNPTALADCLLELANDTQSLKLMGKKALMLAETEFDRQQLAEQFVLWLEKWSRK